MLSTHPLINPEPPSEAVFSCQQPQMERGHMGSCCGSLFQTLSLEDGVRTDEPLTLSLPQSPHLYDGKQLPLWVMP